MGLSKYEKETIIITSEGDDIYSVYTFNTALKRRLASFARKHPDLCILKNLDKEYGSVTYLVDKASLSIDIAAPQVVKK